MQMTALRQRLKELDSRTFQNLCFDLVKGRYPGLRVRQLEGASGDEGIDLFAGELEGNIWIWQCKCFSDGVRKSQKDQIRESLKRALRHRPRSWILCLPVDLDIKAQRWFERLKNSYKTEVGIGLFDGSEIVHELIFRRNIRNMYFPHAVIDAPDIKALLTKTNEYSDEDLEKLTAENMEQYLQRLQDKDPRFAYRVTYYDEVKPEISPTPPTGSIPPNLLASVYRDNRQIDVFARDLEALTLDPPKLELELAPSAVEKLQRQMRTGSVEKILCSEILGLRSSIDFLMPKKLDSLQLIVAPFTTTPSKLLLRTTFKLKSEQVMYQVLEFSVKRKGTEEIEIVAQDPQLPFRLSLVVNKALGVTLNLKACWEGKEIHDIQKVCSALRLMRRGGELELFNLRKDRLWGRVRNPRSEENQQDTNIIGDVDELVEISDAFKTPIHWPAVATEEDIRALRLLLTIIRKGKITHPAGGIATLNLRVRKEIALRNEEIFKKEIAFGIESPTYHPRPVLFGQEFDAGDCTFYCPHVEILDFEATKKAYIAAQDGESVKIRFILREPAHYFFRRFQKNG